MWPNSKQQPLFAVLVAILLIGAIAWEVAAVASRMKQFQIIGDPTPPVRQISTTGTGKVRSVPDVAIVTAGFTVQGTVVRATQEEANRRMTGLVAAVKQAGVAEEDIQTSNFSINPRYVYDQGRAPRIDGYEAVQSIEIHIRNLDRVNDVLAAAGGAGATNIGGLQFTIDDPQRIQSEARGKAIDAARTEALIIARQLGVRLGRIIAFNESNGGAPRPYYAKEMALDIGGGGAPIVEQGSTEVTTSVTVTYELE